MDFTVTEVIEVQLWYGNDINTEHLFIVLLKTLKNERKK